MRVPNLKTCVVQGGSPCRGTEGRSSPSINFFCASLKTYFFFQKCSNLNERCGIFRGGNFPGGNFLRGEFSERRIFRREKVFRVGSFPWEVFSEGGIFWGEVFPGGIFPRTIFITYLIHQVSMIPSSEPYFEEIYFFIQACLSRIV